MERVGGLAGDIIAGFKLVSGECEKHGPSELHVHPTRGAWSCGKCHDEEVMRIEDAKWLSLRHEGLFKVATLPARYAGKKFVPHTSEMKGVRHTARAFRDFVLAAPQWAALILAGKPGTGKTLLATEFAEKWIRDLAKSVRYITANGMVQEIQSAYGAEGKSAEAEVLRFVQYDLLILDEIDAKPDRENANLLLTDVINRRYNEMKPVVVISNQDFDRLEQFVGDRVYSRLHENAFVCAFTWPDFRKAPLPIGNA